MERTIIAFVLISTDFGQEESVLEQIRQTENVKEAYMVYGMYDLIAAVEATSLDKLRETISGKIRTIPKIRSTITMVRM